MKKRKFIYLAIFLLFVGYILFDSGVGSTEAREDVKNWSSFMNGELSYTENVSLDQIMRGYNQITLYVSYCGYIVGAHSEAVLKINNTNSNLSFSAQYDSAAFSKSGDGSSYLSFKTINSNKNINKCGDKVITLSIKDRSKNTTTTKKITVHILAGRQSTSGWQFYLSPTSGKNPSIVVKNGSTTLRNGYDYISEVDVYNDVGMITAGVRPVGQWLAHTPGEVFMLSYYKFSAGFGYPSFTVSSSGVPTANAFAPTTGLSLNWKLKSGIDYTFKYTKVSSDKIKIVYTPLGGSQHISSYGNGNSYFGMYGDTITRYYCKGSSGWGMYAWCNDGDTASEKENFYNNNPNYKYNSNPAPVTYTRRYSTVNVTCSKTSTDCISISNASTTKKISCGEAILVGNCSKKNGVSYCDIDYNDGSGWHSTSNIGKFRIKESLVTVKKPSCTSGNSKSTTNNNSSSNNNNNSNSNTKSNNNSSSNNNNNSNSNTKSNNNSSSATNNNNNNVASSCVSSSVVSNVIGDEEREICYVLGKDGYVEQDILPKDAVICSSGYSMSLQLKNDTCSGGVTACKKTYHYTCKVTARPRVYVNGGKADAKGVGVLKISAKDVNSNSIKGYYISTSEVLPDAVNWAEFKSNDYKESIKKTIGTYYVWVITKDNRISYSVVSRIHE